jgi:hypothetical protein
MQATRGKGWLLAAGLALFGVVLGSGTVGAQPAIVSGQALNTWVETLAGVRDGKGADPEPHLDRKLLEQVNLVRADGVSTGLLGQAGRLPWPPLMREEQFALLRSKFEGPFKTAVTQGRKGKVAPELLKEVQAAHDKLTEKLKDLVADITPTEYISSKRFLNSLQSAIKALNDPAIGELLAASADLGSTRRTVPELVRWMKEKKLTFGPCMGDVSAYTELERQFTAFARRAGK